MRCDTCHGSGRISAAHSQVTGGETAMAPAGLTELPCPDCDGCGIAHCCDGICEQPGREAAARGRSEDR
jgi:hypothetical protein